MVFVRMARSESARALPWISARDSEKLANRTVNQSQMRDLEVEPVERARGRGPAMKTTEMNTDPIQTMNMTGFLDLHPRIQLQECHARRAAQDGKAPQS